LTKQVIFDKKRVSDKTSGFWQKTCFQTKLVIFDKTIVLDTKKVIFDETIVLQTKQVIFDKKSDF